MDSKWFGKIEKSLLFLLRLALEFEDSNGNEAAPHNGGGSVAYSETSCISAEDWPHILTLAKQHTVTGLVYLAVKKLPENLGPRPEQSIRLMLEADKIARFSDKARKVAGEFLTSLKAAGFSPVQMKGHTIADLYPVPQMRVCGDVDLYIPPAEMSDAVSFLRNRGLKVELHPDGSYLCETDVQVDIHSSYFDLHVAEDKLPEISSAEASILMMSAHILKHAMGPGIGLRQICDMAVSLRALKGKYDKDALTGYFKDARILKWCIVLFAFIKKHFGYDAGIFALEELERGHVKRRVRTLETIIFSGGNFGYYAKGRNKVLWGAARKRKTDTFLRFLRHTPFALSVAPKECYVYFKHLIKRNLR